jgi:hypothetical protein
VEALIVVGALFTGGGALLFAVGAFLLRTNRRFDRRAQRAPGEVVDVRWRTQTSSAGGVRHTGYPVLRFTLPDGDTVETVARATTSLDAMHEGQPVTVLYDPDNPRQARLDTRAAGAGSTLLPAVFMSIGGVLAVIGLALLAAGIALDDALPEQ